MLATGDGSLSRFQQANVPKDNARLLPRYLSYHTYGTSRRRVPGRPARADRRARPAAPPPSLRGSSYAYEPSGNGTGPTRPGGQYLKTARPMTFFVGRKPQTWPSSDWFRLSPRTKTWPAGTTMRSSAYAGCSLTKASSCARPLTYSLPPLTSTLSPATATCVVRREPPSRRRRGAPEN